MLKSVFTLFTLTFLTLATFSQNRIVIDDRTGMLDDELEEILSEKLAADNLTYSRILDYSERCAYYFSRLVLSGTDLVIEVEDCNNSIQGSKNLGHRILGSTSQEKGLVLSNAILDIISEPGKYMIQKAIGINQEPGPANVAEPDSITKNEHNTRYFFAPSAYNLKKGELYYNTVYFLLHDVQYGVSDHFSMGIGTTVIGLPIYLTPKVSFPIGKKSALAVGDMLLLGTWGTNAIGNLAYLNYSYGGPDGNVSIGGGYLYTNESNITSETHSPVFNFSTMARMSPYLFFLMENYVLSVNLDQEAWYYITNPSGYSDYYSEQFNQRNTIWYGIAGIRIISKNRDFISWQIGMTYIVNFPGKIPVRYLSWESGASSELNLIAFPTVSFTVKFGKKF
ncbi:MAG: hypothetical protein V2B15_03105 [Bacteroidota bacterium]